MYIYIYTYWYRKPAKNVLESVSIYWGTTTHAYSFTVTLVERVDSVKRIACISLASPAAMVTFHVSILEEFCQGLVLVLVPPPLRLQILGCPKVSRNSFELFS